MQCGRRPEYLSSNNLVKDSKAGQSEMVGILQPPEEEEEAAVVIAKIYNRYVTWDIISSEMRQSFFSVGHSMCQISFLWLQAQKIRYNTVANTAV